MTLIAYPTRVHFADGVLEEALRSELERRGHRRPLLLTTGDLDGSVFQDRVLTGLPRRSGSVALDIPVGCDPRTIVDAALGHHCDRPVDVIVAYGSARAIEIGRKCRRALSDGRDDRMDLFAIPGVDGLPDPCMKNLESWRMGLPSILICDPTLTLGADRAISQAATVMSIARCLESYLAAPFNPPADGMALDGFLRCLHNIHRLDGSEELKVRRDLMAACLNAMMAQEKGVGPAQVLARTLGRGRNIAAILRLVLPGVLATLAQEGDKPAALCAMLGRAGRLDDGMRDVLSDLPFGVRLSEIGVEADDLDHAVTAIRGRNDVSPDAARGILEAVF